MEILVRFFFFNHAPQKLESTIRSILFTFEHWQTQEEKGLNEVAFVAVCMLLVLAGKSFKRVEAAEERGNYGKKGKRREMNRETGYQVRNALQHASWGPFPNVLFILAKKCGNNNKKGCCFVNTEKNIVHSGLCSLSFQSQK